MPGDSQSQSIPDDDCISSNEDDTRRLLSAMVGHRRLGDGADEAGDGLDIEGGGAAVRGPFMTEEEEEELTYSAAHVTLILKPVVVSMVMVTLCIKATQATCPPTHPSSLVSPSFAKSHSATSHAVN